MRKNATAALKFSIILFIAGFIASCSDSSSVQSGPEPTPPEEPSPTRFKDIGPVAADGVLETVTWNIECYGLNSFCANGEINQQTKNILTVLDSINADLYAFQEVADQNAINLLALNMKKYKGFVAKDMVGTQIAGFVYNTNVIDSLSSGLIKIGQPGDWGSTHYTRYPFYFKFAYHTQTTTDTIYAVVIHAEAGDNASDYNSRRHGTKSLHTYLVNNKSKANIILLGDYNDDVDKSIYQGEDSSYEVFIKDNDSFLIVTKEISENGQTTYLGYPDAIDHITISNELFDEYILGSAKALTKVTEWLSISVEEYEGTTTGHYPVRAKFDL